MHSWEEAREPGAEDDTSDGATEQTRDAFSRAVAAADAAVCAETLK